MKERNTKREREVCMLVLMRVCVCECVCVCRHVCVYVCVCVCLLSEFVLYCILPEFLLLPSAAIYHTIDAKQYFKDNHHYHFPINLNSEFTTSWGKHILRPVTSVPKRMTSELGANMSPDGLYDSHSSSTSEYENSGDNTPTPTAVSASRIFFQNKVRVSVASQPNSPLNLPSHPKKYWGYSPYSGAHTSCSLHDNSMLSEGSKDGEQEQERGRERSREFAAKKAVFQSVSSPEKHQLQLQHDYKVRAPGSYSAEKGASVSKRFQEKVWEAMLIREKQQQENRDRDRLDIGSYSSGISGPWSSPASQRNLTFFRNRPSTYHVTHTLRTCRY